MPTASFDEDRPSTPDDDDLLSPAGLDRLAADVRDALVDSATGLVDAFTANPFTVALGATEAAVERLQEQIAGWVEARAAGNAIVVRQRAELARLQSALRAMRKVAADVPAGDDA